MKKQKTYVAMLLAALVILSLAGCGMKNSKDNAEATTGWSVENPDNTTKDKKTTESTDAEDNIEEDADGIMDNLGAGTFDTYEDAKNYLMDKLTADHVISVHRTLDKKRRILLLMTVVIREQKDISSMCMSRKGEKRQEIIM